MSLRSRLAAPMVAACLVLGLGAGALSAPTPALASEGYVQTATSTYTVNPAADRIDVAIDISFTNTKRSTSSTVFYFSSVYVWVEHAATHLRATADAGAATMKRVEQSGMFDEYTVTYSRALYYGQTRRVLVTYQLPSGLPRSSSDIRVGQAIASFCVVGQGDDGGTTKVVIPSQYKVTVTAGGGGTLAEPTGSAASGKSQTWSTGSLDKPYEFWACLSGTNDKGYAVTKLTSPGGREIDLEAWPEDPSWHLEVKTELNDVLGRLETLVGESLPGHGPIVLREVAGSELGSYAGFYNSVTGVIEMGESLGQGDVVAHELSHAWFNNETFFSTWTSEGMAEWARISTVTGSCPEPTSYPGQGRPDLANWQFAGPRATETDLAVIDYQYVAACYIVSTLAAKAGPDHWRAVLDSLFKDELAYRSGSLVLTHPELPATWRQWLDAVDEVGLVPAGQSDLDYAQNLLARYGIADTSLLADRSKARARYHRLVADLGDWTMPEAILQPMSQWSFGIAESGMDQAEAIRASIARANAALPSIDASNGPIRMLFQQAKSVDDLKAAAAQAEDQAKAAEAVAAAAARVAAPRDIVGEVGLAGADIDGPLAAATSAAKAADLAGTQAAVAQVNALLDGAAQQGLIRIVLVVVVTIAVLVLLAFAIRSIRRRRGRRAATLAVAGAAGPTDPSIAMSIAPAGAAPREAAPREAAPAETLPVEPQADPPEGPRPPTPGEA